MIMWMAHVLMQCESNSHTTHKKMSFLIRERMLPPGTLLQCLQDHFRQQLPQNSPELFTPAHELQAVSSPDPALQPGRMHLAQETASCNQAVRCGSLCISLPAREHLLPWPAVEVWDKACKLQAYAVPVKAPLPRQVQGRAYYKMHSLEVGGDAVSTLKHNAEMRRNTGESAMGSLTDTSHRTFRKQTKTDHNTYALLKGIAPEKLWRATDMHLCMWNTLLLWSTDIAENSTPCNVYSYFVKF